MDFQKHNEEVRQVWAAYRSGNPIRVPILFGVNPRYTMGILEANPRRITFQQYFEDPQKMLERQIEHAYWVRHHIPQDAEMGLPQEGWSVYVDFQNTYEAAWLGAPLYFSPGQVPDTRPFLQEENKYQLFDQGIPDPFQGGLMARNWEFYDFFLQKQKEGFEMFGRPIASVQPCGMGTDGPLTVCCNLRGATEFMSDLMEDRDYALHLLDFVTRSIILRIKAYRKRLNLPEKAKAWGFADDAIELLSPQMYQEWVFPFHRQLVEELAEPEAPISIHLCGDAQRHFLFLRDYLKVRSFDTGYPVDLGRARRELGPEVELLGGPSAPLLHHGSPQEVREEVLRILHSGVMEGGQFILREGNNLAPGTPLENLRVMYEVGKEYGRYRGGKVTGGAQTC